MKLSELLDRLEEDASREAMLAQTVKNPDTNQDITVKTALSYDKEHPARKAAAKIYAQFMNKNTPSAAPKPAAKPALKKSYNTKLRNMQQRQNPLDSDDGYDATRDDALERGTWRPSGNEFYPRRRY